MRAITIIHYYEYHYLFINVFTTSHDSMRSFTSRARSFNILVVYYIFSFNIDIITMKRRHNVGVMVITIGPSKRGRAEDGKLLSRLEWPNDNCKIYKHSRAVDGRSEDSSVKRLDRVVNAHEVIYIQLVLAIHF